jgi:hypothetical protein
MSDDGYDTDSSGVGYYITECTRDSDGKLHRDVSLGPAIINRGGTTEYWVDGIQVNKDGTPYIE